MKYKNTNISVNIRISNGLAEITFAWIIFLLLFFLIFMSRSFFDSVFLSLSLTHLYLIAHSQLTAPITFITLLIFSRNMYIKNRNENQQNCCTFLFLLLLFIFIRISEVNYYYLSRNANSSNILYKNCIFEFILFSVWN